MSKKQKIQQYITAGFTQAEAAELVDAQEQVNSYTSQAQMAAARQHQERATGKNITITQGVFGWDILPDNY